MWVAGQRGLAVIFSLLSGEPFQKWGGSFAYSKGGEGMAKEWQNKEGYADPTAYHALKNIEDEKKVNELVFVLKWIINKSGFELVERIQLRDKKNGKIYK